MGRRLRCYEIAADAVRMADNKIPFDEALERAQKWYKTKPLFFGYTCHVGFNDVSESLARLLLKEHGYIVNEVGPVRILAEPEKTTA